MLLIHVTQINRVVVFRQVLEVWNEYLRVEAILIQLAYRQPLDADLFQAFTPDSLVQVLSRVLPGDGQQVIGAPAG